MPPLRPHSTADLDLEALQNSLRGRQGKAYWRSLEELAGTEAFAEMLHREFPEQASEWTNPITRRRFLTLMGASLALAGLSGCGRQPAETIYPYVKLPEGMVPGKPLFFASAHVLSGLARGVLVESHMGRPTKVEGNPDHPASLGATDAIAQASLLTMYDPERSQTLTYLGKVRTWAAFLGALRDARKIIGPQGAGLRILTGSVSSPTFHAQLDALFTKPGFEKARWHVHEPARSSAAIEGARLAFGKDLQPRYHLAPLAKDDPDVRADVIVALDADLAGGEAPGSLRYARELASRRSGKHEEMNRLYVLESMPTPTGAIADHRLPMKATDVDAFARALAARLGVPGVDAESPAARKYVKWVDAIAQDLQYVDGDEGRKRAPGSTLVVAGEGQPPAVHALAYAINERLGNIGKTVVFLDPVTYPQERQPGTLEELAREMEGGDVKVLLILESNPVFTAPADLHFAGRMGKVPVRIHLGLYQDETARLCHWHVPASHTFESWGDARSFDGTATVIQPLIAPLYSGKTAHDVVAGLLQEETLSSHELVKKHWQVWWLAREDAAGDFELFWKRSLHRGVVEGSAYPAREATLREGFAGRLPELAEPRGLEIVFRPDPAIYDGLYANNGWLQELPKPITKITWDNAAHMSPQTARDLGVSYSFGASGGEHGQAHVDRVTLRVHGRELTMPAWIVPGHADGSVTVHFGYGRSAAGRVGNGTGFDVYTLRASHSPWMASGLDVQKAQGRYLLACTQGHHSMEGRNLVRSATAAEYQKNPHFAQEAEGHHGGEGGEAGKTQHLRTPLSLYPEDEYRGHRWGMVIDLGACTGCSSCVVACQAENNSPVVGKEEVARGREMHWLRIDRYYQGDPFDQGGDVDLLHQPVLCMHCEKAPCEVVCPVAATVHSYDGLNDMVYNRCVGTRYCSNNCPYKVRRFNFFEYADFATESLKLMRNPEVTVRSVGVMEKCTYCVQRIRTAEIEAEKQGRPIRDGEVVTACQAACPTQAIVFGDLNGRNAEDEPGSMSRVARLRASELSYGLLTELNTQPRTTYLAVVRNPSPLLS